MPIFTKRCFLVDENRVIMPAYGTILVAFVTIVIPCANYAAKSYRVNDRKNFPIPISKAN